MPSSFQVHVGLGEKACHWLPAHLSFLSPATTGSDSQFVSGLPRPVAGRRQGLGERQRVGQGRGSSNKGVTTRTWGPSGRASHHHQGQAAGDAEGRLRRHTQAHAPHPRAAGSGDRPQHACHPGQGRACHLVPSGATCRLSLKWGWGSSFEERSESLEGWQKGGGPDTPVPGSDFDVAPEVWGIWNSLNLLLFRVQRR